MNKDKIIPIRATVEEKEAFERAADLAGTSLSSWARQKLRSAAIADLKEVGEKPKFLDAKPKKAE